MIQFTADSPAVAAQVNQNFNNLNTRIEEVNTTIQTQLTQLGAQVTARTPAGTIAFFAGACPSGWSRYTQANGRFIVGTPTNGMAARTMGPSPLADNTEPMHNHLWAYLTPDLVWTTHNVFGTPGTMIDWNDGMDQTGSGIYPIALDLTPTANWEGHTNMKSANIPFIQLTACSRDP